MFLTRSITSYIFFMVLWPPKHVGLTKDSLLCLLLWSIQANNAYIFPGLGLGLVISGAIRVHDEMLLAACKYTIYRIMRSCSILLNYSPFPSWVYFYVVSIYFSLVCYSFFSFLFGHLRMHPAFMVWVKNNQTKPNQAFVPINWGRLHQSFYAIELYQETNVNWDSIQSYFFLLPHSMLTSVYSFL